MGRGWGWSFGRWSCAEGEHIPLWRGQNLGQASKGGGFGWRADLGQAWQSRTGKLVTASPGACRVDYVFHQRKNDNSKALPARFALIATAIHALLIHSSAHKRTFKRAQAHRAARSLPEQSASLTSRVAATAEGSFAIHHPRYAPLFTQPLVARGQSRAIGIRGAPPRAESIQRSRSKSPACTRIRNPREKP